MMSKMTDGYKKDKGYRICFNKKLILPSTEMNEDYLYRLIIKVDTDPKNQKILVFQGHSLLSSLSKKFRL